MYIKVRVVAGQRKEKIDVLKEDSLKLWLKEKAERNLANTRVLEIIAKHFKVAKGKVKIINGHNSPSKLLVINV
jgi:uncharacterized protein YggU (UPF0235/DUF167 family)